MARSFLLTHSLKAVQPYLKCFRVRVCQEAFLVRSVAIENQSKIYDLRLILRFDETRTKGIHRPECLQIIRSSGHQGCRPTQRHDGTMTFVGRSKSLHQAISLHLLVPHEYTREISGQPAN